MDYKDLVLLVESMMEKEILQEQAETIGADINEIWFAYLAAGKNWNNLGDGADAQQTLEQRMGTLKGSESAEEAEKYINIQKGRSEAQLKETQKWIDSSEAFSGKVTKAYWTAREGTLSAVVNEGLPAQEHLQIPQAGSGGNPTDVAIRLSTGDILGISLKSTGGKGNISFKAGGFDSTMRRLEEFGVVPNYSAGDSILGEKEWAKVKEMAVKAASADLPTSLYEAAKNKDAPKERVKGVAAHAKAQKKPQSQKVRKQYIQTLQFFGLPEEDRMPMLLKKYRNQEKADAKAEEFSEWARYLQRLMPPEKLQKFGGTFQGYAANWYRTHKSTGNDILGKARDIMLDGMNQLDQPSRAAFLLKEYINATAITPYWIKVTGMGDKPPFGAKAVDVNNSPRYAKLNNSEITFESVAGGTIGVKAGGERIITIRNKWESAPLTTNIKTDTKNW